MTKKSSTFSRLIVGVAGLGLVTALGACATPDSTSTTTNESPIAGAPESPMAESPMAGSDSASGTLDEVVANTSTFSTLNAAIQAAGLEETLSGTESYTIFAPTDEAFAALPDGALDQLLLPENKEALQQLLSYHVVPGNVTSADITPGDVTTVEGSPVSINTSAGEVTVGNATVVEADIAASNGVIHAIDQVLLPPDVPAQ
jgi:uncharacterized surface protein with fasciclin (FAS1) repeats